MKIVKNVPLKMNRKKMVLFKYHTIRDGWEAISEKNNTLKFKKMIGDTKFPEKHFVTWYLDAYFKKKSIEITINVPLYYQWEYSENRGLKIINKLLSAFDEDWKVL